MFLRLASTRHRPHNGWLGRIWRAGEQIWDDDGELRLFACGYRLIWGQGGWNGYCRRLAGCRHTVVGLVAQRLMCECRPLPLFLRNVSGERLFPFPVLRVVLEQYLLCVAPRSAFRTPFNAPSVGVDFPSFRSCDPCRSSAKDNQVRHRLLRHLRKVRLSLSLNWRAKFRVLLRC